MANRKSFYLVKSLNIDTGMNAVYFTDDKMKTMMKDVIKKTFPNDSDDFLCSNGFSGCYSYDNFTKDVENLSKNIAKHLDSTNDPTILYGMMLDNYMMDSIIRISEEGVWKIAEYEQEFDYSEDPDDPFPPFKNICHRLDDKLIFKTNETNFKKMKQMKDKVDEEIASISSEEYVK